MRKTQLKRTSKSPEALAKKEIQRLLREIVIIRDRVCQRCGVSYGTNGVIFQCDHLLSRSHSATYSDSGLCVLLCKPCHAWKSLGGNVRQFEYDSLIRSKLPPERVRKWDLALEWRYKPTKMDWGLEIVALNQILKKLSTQPQ